MSDKTKIEVESENVWRTARSVHERNSVAAIVIAFVVSIGTLIYSALADIPQPVLKIAPTGTNQFLITITNGVTNINYELYRSPVLGDPANYPFTLHIIGEQGQTNFTINMGTDASAFVRAAVGSDWDSDGIPNFMDANPSDDSVGALSLTIDSPINGSALD